jgi:hypothetical protein
MCIITMVDYVLGSEVISSLHQLAQSQNKIDIDPSRANIQILLASSLVAFVTVGFSNAFGIFEAYYLETLPVNSSAISWLGSLAIFFLFAGSLFVSIILRKVHPRVGDVRRRHIF